MIGRTRRNSVINLDCFAVASAIVKDFANQKTGERKFGSEMHRQPTVEQSGFAPAVALKGTGDVEHRFGQPGHGIRNRLDRHATRSDAIGYLGYDGNIRITPSGALQHVMGTVQAFGSGKMQGSGYSQSQRRVGGSSSGQCECFVGRFIISPDLRHVAIVQMRQKLKPLHCTNFGHPAFRLGLIILSGCRPGPQQRSQDIVQT